MAGAEDAADGSGCAGRLRSRVGLRSGSCSGESQEQLRAVKSMLLERLGPHERLLTYLQSVLLWERRFHSVLLFTTANVMFWWVEELYLHGFNVISKLLGLCLQPGAFRWNLYIIHEHFEDLV